MSLHFSLTDKVAIVTGACGLLGQEHSSALAEAGAHVIVADLDQKACDKLARSLTETYAVDCIGIAADVTDKRSIEQARDRILERFGSIDVLVNNAAINEQFENPQLAAEQSKFEHFPLEIWQKSIDVNVTGLFLASQVWGSVMAQQGVGSIINIASTYGLVGPNQSIYQEQDGSQTFYKSPAYPTTKGAVLNFTRYLASYWGPKGVRVNTLTPGGVQNGQAETFIKNYERLTPLGRMADKGDYKEAIVFLASDASRYMTGANLVVDGGWTAW